MYLGGGSLRLLGLLQTLHAHHLQQCIASVGGAGIPPNVLATKAEATKPVLNPTHLPCQCVQLAGGAGIPAACAGRQG